MHLSANMIVYIVVYVRVYVCPLHRSSTLFKLSLSVWGLILLFTQALEHQGQLRLRTEAWEGRREEVEREEERAELEETEYKYKSEF